MRIGTRVTDGLNLDKPTAEDRAAIAEGWRTGRLRRRVIAGGRWFRVLSAPDAAHAEKYACVAYPSEKSARFTPLRRASAIVPSAYAARTARLALWEGILRSVRHDGVKRIPARATRDRYLLRVSLRRTRLLVNLTRPAISNVVPPRRRPPDLSAAWPQAYPVTQAWSQCVSDVLPECQGFLYESHQISGQCVVLFEPGPEPLFDLDENFGLVSRGWQRDLLLKEADKAGVAVDFDELLEGGDDE
jgi:hypothetical protein